MKQLTKRQKILLRNRTILVCITLLVVILIVKLISSLAGRSSGTESSKPTVSSTVSSVVSSANSSAASSVSSVDSASVSSAASAAESQPVSSENAGTVSFEDPELGTVTIHQADFPQNAYSAQSFTLRNGFKKLADTSTPSFVGVDVSAHQKDIAWNKVASAGVDFAMLRACFRGYGSGDLAEDANFVSNATAATKAGIKIGAYVFSQAISVEEAREEANYLLNLLQENKSAFSVTYPVVFDWEFIDYDNARTDVVSAAEVTAFANAFCELVKEAGYTPMVYVTPKTAYMMYDLSQMTDFALWYSEEADSPRFYYAPDVWQYSLSGEVNGINGLVDLNVSFRDFSKK